MKCELCGEESNIIYATKNGLICPMCFRKLKNNDEEKLIQRKKLSDMYKKYGLIIDEDGEVVR